MNKISPAKERIGYLILIMAAVSVLVTGIAIGMLYFAAFDEEEERLREIADNQARLIEAVASFDEKHSKTDHPQGAYGATLSQIMEARKKSGTFGSTGELCLAELKNNQIAFLLKHRHPTGTVDKNIPMGADIADPIQAALQGKSGAMVGLDYRGEKVLAAFEPVQWPGRTIAVTAKIDLSEIRAPFIKAGIISLVATFLAVILGAVLFKAVSNPLIKQLEENEEALSKSEKNIRSIFENMQDTYYRTDIEGRLTMASPSAVKLLGYNLEELMGKQLANFYADPHKREEFLKALKESGGLVEAYETELKRKDGSKFWVSTNAHYCRDEDGKICGVEGSVRNITQRKKAEEELKKSYIELDGRVEERTSELSEANKQLIKEVAQRKRIESALRESEQRLNNVLIHIKDVVWSFSPSEKRLLYMSPAAEIIYGRPVSDFFDNSNLWLEMVHPEDRSQVERSNELLAAHGYKELIYRIIQPGGKIHWIEDRAWIVIDKDASLSVIHGIASDITDKKISENEAKLHHQQLIRADKMKSLGVLVSGVAHEINNPNNFILLNAQTLEELIPPILEKLDKLSKKDGEEISQFMSNEELLKEVPDLLKGIGESSKRIKRIVKKLKDFSTQASTDYFQDVIINDVVDSAIIIASSLIRNSTNHFKIDYGPNLPIIKGNSQELEQVIINLITNACHALPTKEKAIRISTAYNKNKHAVEVRVVDEGCGIPGDIMDNITEPFFTTKRDTGGTGLGLSVSFTIVQSHRGELKFNSEQGKGTEAIMRLFSDPDHMIERRSNDR